MLNELALLLINIIIINNIVLVQFLGLYPILNASNKIQTAINISVATTIVLTAASVCNFVIYNFLLVPLELTFLKTIAFFLFIAMVVLLFEMLVKKNRLPFIESLVSLSPLIITNSAILGVALLNVNQQHKFLASIVFSFGAAVGFSLVLISFTVLRDRLSVEYMPKPFQGAPIEMITLGLVSMAFTGLSGLV